jgi:hypothetical protein
MGQCHPLLTRWEGLGRKMAFRLPMETFEHLMDALEAAEQADLGDIVEGIAYLHEVATFGCAEVTLDELLALIEARVRDARNHDAIRLVRGVRGRPRRLRSV